MRGNKLPMGLGTRLSQIYAPRYRAEWWLCFPYSDSVTVLAGSGIREAWIKRYRTVNNLAIITLRNTHTLTRNTHTLIFFFFFYRG